LALNGVILPVIKNAEAKEIFLIKCLRELPEFLLLDIMTYLSLKIIKN